MTAERPLEDARMWLFNTADRPVDLYVNYHDEPWTTIKPEEDQGAFTIDSDADRIYGTYTFEAREAGDPDDPPLASVSVKFEEHDSYALVFHQTDDAEYDMSIYKNDFSPSAASRFEIRHTGEPEEIDWYLFPQPQADPRIPDDERSGTLERGQWQQAIDVTENDYRLEIYNAEDELIAFRQDLDVDHEKMIVVYLVGDPQWWMGADEKEGHIFRQEFKLQVGEKRPDETTPPAEPYATEDTNQHIQFDCDPVELYHTNLTEVEINATDPDGIVADMAIVGSDPYSDGFHVPDESVDRAFAIGGTTDATFRVTPKVPPGSYDVEIMSNPHSLGERVTCHLPVEVEPITVARLQDLVDQYLAANDMTPWLANELHDVLHHAKEHLEADEILEACGDLKRVVTLVGEHKDAEISVEATVDLETETKALRAYLGCG